MQFQWPQGRRIVTVTRSGVSHPTEIAWGVAGLVRAHRALSLGVVATMTGHTVSELRAAVVLLEQRGQIAALSAEERELLEHHPSELVLRTASAHAG